MTKEDKELLLKDLCARLPYGVKVHGIFLNYNKDKDKILYEECNRELNYKDLNRYESLKPYLRPMSSMTEEEKGVLELCNAFVEPRSIELKVDIYNKQHLDYRGLIEKGLAIAVTKENNPYEKFNS